MDRQGGRREADERVDPQWDVRVEVRVLHLPRGGRRGEGEEDHGQDDGQAAHAGIPPESRAGDQGAGLHAAPSRCLERDLYGPQRPCCVTTSPAAGAAPSSGDGKPCRRAWKAWATRSAWALARFARSPANSSSTVPDQSWSHRSKWARASRTLAWRWA